MGRRIWCAVALAVLALMLARGAALACSVDPDCDDGVACNGAETCQDGACVAGMAVDCSTLADQCNDAICSEPTAACVVFQKLDGFGCDDGDACTAHDICQNGTCIGTDGADSDGDGYCDVQEVQAQCDPNDPQEIPPQPNTYSGGRTNSPGELLLAFRAPTDRDVNPATDASCATAGSCNPVTHFCAGGKINDPCDSNSDCNQPADTCRIIINYAATSDLTLQEVYLKRRGQPRQDLLPDFLPVKPGCSRKVDISLPPGFKRANLRLKASGTTSGKSRKDRDRIRFRE